MDTSRKIKLMKIDEIADLLKVSKPTIRRYAEQGIVKKYQPFGKGGAVRYYLEESVHE